MFHEINFIKLSEHEVSVWKLEEERSKCQQNVIRKAFKINFKKIGSGFRIPTTSKMEQFMTIVNGRKLLTIITKNSNMDVTGAQDAPLENTKKFSIKKLLLLFFSSVFLVYNVNAPFVPLLKYPKSVMLSLFWLQTTREDRISFSKTGRKCGRKINYYLLGFYYFLQLCLAPL